jgi:hypothetical protein
MAWICPCGATIGDDQQLCRACGHQLLQPVARQLPSQPQQPTSQVTFNYPQRPSVVNDLRAMGGTGAAKLSFGASFGIAAGWTLGKFFGCLVIIAVIIGVFFVIGVLARLSRSGSTKTEHSQVAEEATPSPANTTTESLHPDSIESGSERIENRTNDPLTSPEPSIRPPNETVNPTSGVLCNGIVSVPQHGEIVFKDLPADRLKLTFDHDAWQPTIHRQPDGTQTLEMRSIKPGIQTNCEIRWEIAR